MTRCKSANACVRAFRKLLPRDSVEVRVLKARRRAIARSHDDSDGPADFTFDNQVPLCSTSRLKYSPRAKPRCLHLFYRGKSYSRLSVHWAPPLSRLSRVISRRLGVTYHVVGRCAWTTRCVCVCVCVSVSVYVRAGRRTRAVYPRISSPILGLSFVRRLAAPRSTRAATSTQRDSHRLGDPVAHAPRSPRFLSSRPGDRRTDARKEKLTDGRTRACACARPRAFTLSDQGAYGRKLYFCTARSTQCVGARAGNWFPGFFSSAGRARCE